MLVVVSPAKKLDMSAVDAPTPSAPHFADEANALAEVAKDLSEADLQKLMKISAPLAKLNAERFANFGHQDTKQAALAFAGDTYQGLEAGTLDADEMAWAQDHFRILSGLYGLLRPLDAMEPYRLEMGSRLKTARGKSLYDWWGDRIATALNAQAETVGTDTLINCASQEYFGAVDPKALKLDVITPVFMEERAGTPKIISFYAKKARGAMARFVIQNRLTTAEGLKDFDSGGYAFDAKASVPGKLVFIRPEAAQKDAA
ncbi:peroxide stress protein YaaA [Roseovarius sp. LXJ103]|uniref:peroxide stress protein YaaA n=1 Tax=Roseovarius carneus TaxID=2853164 RepID=UPI000D61C0D4|nr:peroxide stress protein YaaA [Roseovarius carneus]MBZ8117818.1 peroxide stress protein YaaA [Roseovarius carneus]PWE36417.1 peroxide stress protein YaaA [Pelagicola sp. LXJ1103]